MRHGAIHGETNSCPKAIHARQGNSLATGRDASPIFVDGHGGRPERDVEGAVPYGGGANLGDIGRCGEWGEVAGGRLPPLRGGANPEDRGRCEPGEWGEIAGGWLGMKV